MNPFGLTARTLVNPDDIGDLEAFIRDEVRAVELPAANGIGTARSVAKAYGCLATGGAELGLTAGVRDALANPAIPPTEGLRDKGIPCRHLVLTWLRQALSQVQVRFIRQGVRNARSRWLIGDAYAMNRAGFHLYNDPRELALRQVLFHDIVGSRSQQTHR